MRYEAVHDRTQAIPAILGAAPLGVQTPLSNLGSRTMTVVRYADVGFDLTDPSNMNVDIEGLNWAPVGGQVVADNFTNFAISLSHSRFLPDEAVDPFNNPVFPGSGLVAAFANNLADPNNDPLMEVHPKERGYIVSPGDLFASTTGTLMMPYPLNRGVPQSEYRHYTWRDTALLARAATNGAGIEIANNIGVLGLPPEPEFAVAMIGYAAIQPPGDVSSMGLPLLLEFKTYPDGGALGLNSFDVSFSNGAGITPFFRAFSTGGTDTNTAIDAVEPDLEDSANGGFNPLSTPVPGVATPGLDDTFYIGSMDLVVRVSRSYSVWFGTAPSGILLPSYNPAVTEPSAAEQPEGTSIQIAYRGAAEFAHIHDMVPWPDAPAPNCV
ncbi:MAG TPA: hypothetical protein EYQ83_00320, partial [Acidobacteria bacterium]|nr:hypothetical protein [Acidobacteriota bacterium]